MSESWEKEGRGSGRSLGTGNQEPKPWVRAEVRVKSPAETQAEGQYQVSGSVLGFGVQSRFKSEPMSIPIIRKQDSNNS